jgi:pimeloyl-ACP methyl ester carboxylesterase
VKSTPNVAPVAPPDAGPAATSDTTRDTGRARLPAAARAAILIGCGAVVIAVGVGLVPQLLENFPSIGAVLSIVSITAGLGAVVLGVRTAAHRWWGRVGAAVGALITVGLVVSVVSPGVAVTNVPPSAVTTTPGDAGLPFEEVSLTTDDGVRLAAWFVPGDRTSSVVLLHGAGSTRSAVVRHAAVLHRNGFGVLLVDARGHGDSDGRAMDFGWNGDEDVTAGVEFLADRGDRVAVVGMSMGGEEAIGAAAADRRISAVVAEGATARTAADKRWLSDTYGWRGWVQEQIERAQYGITDVLSPASPPTPLRDAVEQATGTPFLLITAGDVADEAHAAAFIRSGAPERVTVWTVDGAGHTDGLTRAADEWERRVVDFLDEHLGSG